MSLIDFCTKESQHGMENSEAEGRQAEMQVEPAEAEASGRQEMHAEAPAEAPVEVRAEAEASVNLEAEAHTPAEAEQDAPADGLQDGRQILPADMPAEGPHGQVPDVAEAKAPEDRATLAGPVARFLPPKRERPVMENVTMRLSPAVKQKAKALAHARGMSLSEFCAAVIGSVVAAAAEEPSEAA